MKKSILLRAVLGGTLLLVGAYSIAFAKDGANGSQTEARAQTDTSNQVLVQSSSATETQTLADRHALEQEAIRMRQSAKLEAKLDDTKKRQCEKIAADIVKHTQNFIATANNQLRVFDAISQKAQDFAKNKNLTVATEATLLTQIAAARAKVVDDLATLKSDAEAFNCDGSNPKGALKAFHSDAALVRTDLKAYRTLVRQLIQAVRQANGQTTAAKTDDEAKTGVSNATHQ